MNDECKPPVPKKNFTCVREAILQKNLLKKSKKIRPHCAKCKKCARTAPNAKKCGTCEKNQKMRNFVRRSIAFFPRE